jgi:hypothetical protein
MNIVTPYPSNIPINTVNITTESARRDNQLREVIAKPSATEAGVAERGVASEHDKSKTPQQNQNSVEANLQGDDHKKIGERGQGEKDQEGKEQQQQQAEKQLAQAEQKAAQLDGQEVQELKSRDAEVRAHEAAHAAAGGQYAGSPTYEFKRGPNGNRYAVGGEVSIDTSAVSGDPRATINKMLQVRAAALAPANPSGQDRSVAAQASQISSDAQAEEVQQNADKVKAEQAEAADKQARRTEAADAAKAEASENANNQGKAVDPFNLLGTDDEDKSSTGATKANIFGSSGLAGGTDRNQINLNRQDSEQRNAAVVARASRVQNFYAASTVPSGGGFSQFA